MNLWEKIIAELELTLLTDGKTLERQVLGAYCGDLLSDVLAHASPGDIWITIHRHRNIIAVASLVNLHGIIITGNRSPEPDTLEFAQRENIPLFISPFNSFHTTGKLYTVLSEYSVISK